MNSQNNKLLKILILTVAGRSMLLTQSWVLRCQHLRFTDLDKRMVWVLFIRDADALAASVVIRASQAFLAGS